MRRSLTSRGAVCDTGRGRARWPRDRQLLKRRHLLGLLTTAHHLAIVETSTLRGARLAKSSVAKPLILGPAARPATMAVVVLGVETAGMVAVGITGPYQPSPGDPDFGCSKEDGGDLFSSGGELPSLWGYGQQDDRSRRVVYISRSVAQATRRLLERRCREDVF